MKYFLYLPLFWLLITLPLKSFSASSGVALDPVEIDVNDTASLQRGAKLFVNYCFSCHSAAYMRYNRIGKDLDLTDAEVKQQLIFSNDKVGDLMENAMRPEDAEKWFGVVPPDLSVIARSRGTEWLYTYMRTFYLDDNKIMGTNNLVYKDVGMPHVFWRQQGYLDSNDKGILDTSKLDGEVVASYDDMMQDLVNFLAYLGEPSKIQRLAVGKWVLIYLVIFFFLAYAMKRAFWEDIH